MGTETKKTKKKYWKTVIEVTVLSEDKPVGEGLELDDIHYEITEGHCSGDIVIKSQKQVCAKTMAKLLESQGSDPGFFQLDEDGKELED